MKNVLSRYALNCFTICCIGFGLVVLPSTALAGQEVIVNGENVVGAVVGNSTLSPPFPYTETDLLDPTTTLDDPDNNKVTINSGTVDSMEVQGEYVSVVGGLHMTAAGAASAFGNSVIVNNGTMNAGVLGGAAITGGADSVTASGNSVIVNDGTVGWISGGIAATGGAGSATASGNSVIVNDGTVIAKITGGGASSAVSATASGNSVVISGGTVDEIVGGSAGTGGAGSATASGNSVTISGGMVNGEIFGGVASGLYADAIHNIVTITGSPTFDPSVNLVGGAGVGSGDFFTGNTLNLKTPINVSGVYNFEYYNFYIPTDMTAGQTMLTVDDPMDITGSTVRVGINGGTSALNVGDQITLIDTTGAGLTADAALDGSRAQGIQGIANIIEFDLSLDADNLYATAAVKRGNEQLKALSEGRAAGLAFVSQGADMIMGQGMGSLLSATRTDSIASFGAAIGGGSSRYKTGSHIDVDGVSMLVGLGLRTPRESGSIVAGAFFEAGWGNYSSRNSFNNAPSVKGKGDTSYYGGGVLGRYEAPTGMYAEASLRAGRVKNDFRSSDILNSDSDTTKYDSGSAYYGAHAGLGYVWNMNEKASLDMSTRYIWTHQASDSVTISGDRIKFKDADSQRWRTGARLSYAASDYVSPYVGAYYDYEFGGKVKATANGESIAAPSLKGGTGVGELGLSFAPSRSTPLSIDLGVQGYTGRRQGVTGSLQLKFEF